MGYEDTFYIKENIIGYTGELYENPTVYFLKKHPDGRYEYGRITQDHGDRDNIGRGIVRYSKDYWIGNKAIDNLGLEGRSKEKISGKTIHESRSLLIKVFNPSAQVNTLASAIGKFKEIKPKYYYSI